MLKFRAALLACSGVIALAATPAHASVDEYSLSAGETASINLEVCSAESQLAVRGDTSTDLDFVVANPNGENVHTDTGGDDYMSIVLEKAGDGCKTFNLGVANLGEEDNTFTVVLEPISEGSTRVQKYLVQAGERQKVNFKACGTSANVTARGDGDTDLDYTIRNSDGAVVHEDEELSDETTATLAGLRSDCETFELEVANLGEVYNAMMLVVEPQGVTATPYSGPAPSTSLASTGGGTTKAEGSGAGIYRAEANSSLNVTLPICGMTRVEVVGDGDTDLDFTLVNSAGEEVHSDIDLSDATFAHIDAPEACDDHTLTVNNLGGVYNEFTVNLVDLSDNRPVSGAGEYNVRESGALKVPLRVCGTTYVDARGDGDTDLDFTVNTIGGERVHEDLDLTDQTGFTLEPGEGCGDYNMEVRNIGDVFNVMTVRFGDSAADFAARETAADAAGDAVAIGEFREDTTTLPPAVAVQDEVSIDEHNRYVTIVNATGKELLFVYWSNSATLSWGDDQLGPTETLSAGQRWEVNMFDGSRACLFDFRATDGDDKEYTLEAVNVCEVFDVTFE